MQEIQHNFVDNKTKIIDFIDTDTIDNSFLLDINGYEGAIDLLLDLAKKQKVDLINISILELANQYLDYVEMLKI